MSADESTDSDYNPESSETSSDDSEVDSEPTESSDDVSLSSDVSDDGDPDPLNWSRSAPTSTSARRTDVGSDDKDTMIQRIQPPPAEDPAAPDDTVAPDDTTTLPPRSLITVNGLTVAMLRSALKNHGVTRDVTTNKPATRWVGIIKYIPARAPARHTMSWQANTSAGTFYTSIRYHRSTTRTCIAELTVI
eukprot:SAG31_NODE_2655_length_5290_cov_14.429204_2_plen_191_part_00